MIRYLIRYVLEILWWDWQLVGTFEDMIKLRRSYLNHEHKIYIHCYESRWGSRRVSIKIVDASTLFNGGKVRSTAAYQTEVFPWLNRRANTKIPAYDLVASGKFDFLKRLKGETPIVLNDDEK